MHMQCKDPTREQKLVFLRKACVPMVSTYSTQQVVAHRSTAANTVPSGHVRRAPYLRLYFRRSLWSHVLWHALRGEPSSTRFVVRKLTVAALHNGQDARRGRPKWRTRRHPE